MKIGFVGLGIMGRPMALNLKNGGHDLYLFSRSGVAQALLDAGIPAGPILDYAEALGNEHAQARDMVMPITHPVEGEVKNIGFPVKLRGTPQEVRRHPPLLGEHSDDVLQRLLGLDQQQIAALRNAGVV